MRGRLTFVTALIVLLIACAALVFGLPRLVTFDSAYAGEVVKNGEVREYGYGLIRFNGRGPEWHRWHRILDNRDFKALLEKARAENRKLHAELRRKYEPTFDHYFEIAARTYRVDKSMLKRKGSCESVRFTDFYNETPIYNGEHAQGVMGFIPSTFASTPFKGLDVRHDHLANIMAGAWMHKAGRGGEWACR